MVDCGHYKIKDNNGNEYIVRLESENNIPRLIPVGSSRGDFSAEFVWLSEVEKNLETYAKKDEETVFTKFSEAYERFRK